MMPIRACSTMTITLLLTFSIIPGMHAADQKAVTPLIKKRARKKQKQWTVINEEQSSPSEPKTVLSPAPASTEQDPEIASTNQLHLALNTALKRWTVINNISSTLDGKKMYMQSRLMRLALETSTMQSDMTKCDEDLTRARADRMTALSDLVKMESSFNTKLSNTTGKVKAKQRKTRAELNAILNQPDIASALQQLGINRQQPTMQSAQAMTQAQAANATTGENTEFTRKVDEPSEAELLRALTKKDASTEPAATTSVAVATQAPAQSDTSWLGLGWLWGSTPAPAAAPTEAN